METFHAPPLLGNPHLQTLWSPLLRKQPSLVRDRERLNLPDGDFIDVDWHPGQQVNKSPLVVLLHGLTGSSSSAYMLGMQKAVARLGWQSVAMNFRGCSGRPNRLPRAYHSGDTGDINYLLKLCRKRFPGRMIFVIGYSLGGNALCKWLGEQADAKPVDGAVAVSAPYQLDQCATRLDRGFSKLYRKHLIGELVNLIEQKKTMFQRLGQRSYWQQLHTLGPLNKIRSFWQFDDQVVAPLHGFDSAGDYYNRSSARQFIPLINIPTLLVHARDDPFMPSGVIPERSECPQNVELAITPKGGHVGFVMADKFVKSGVANRYGKYWLEYHIPGWLQNLQQQQQ